MTKEEFVKAYAERSDVSVEYLLTVRRPVPCDCGHPWCGGWALVTMDQVDDVEKLMERARRLYPDRSDEWLAVWLGRMAWYVRHDGDMTGAPELPT